MSEASEKVLGIKQIPLFPLPLVLLPYELLPLHIFEPRYQKMLEDIEFNKNIFGVSLFDSQESFLGKPETGTIGCVAEVSEKQLLEDGRSNVLTIGVIRYRLIDYLDEGTEYLVGIVEFFEDEKEDANILQPLADEVYDLFTRFAKAAHKMSGQQGTFPEIPKAEPEQLSFLVSTAFNLDNKLKYKLLKTRSTSERLNRLKDILKESVKQVEETAKINKISRTNGHANKKIDIDL